MKEDPDRGTRSDRLTQANRWARSHACAHSSCNPVRCTILGLMEVGLLVPDRTRGFTRDSIPEQPDYDYLLALLRPVYRGVRDQLVRSRLHSAVTAQADGRDGRIWRVFENLADMRRQVEVQLARQRGEFERDRRPSQKTQRKKGRRRGKSKTRRGHAIRPTGFRRTPVTMHG